MGDKFEEMVDHQAGRALHPPLTKKWRALLDCRLKDRSSASLPRQTGEEEEEVEGNWAKHRPRYMVQLLSLDLWHNGNAKTDKYMQLPHVNQPPLLLFPLSREQSNYYTHRRHMTREVS